MTEDNALQEEMNFKARVLIVDDRRSVVWFIERVLQKEGFDTVTAFDGLEGLQKVKEEKPDLIILDTIMPKMDGYKVYHYLKENPDTVATPVLFLTNKGEAYERTRLASAVRRLAKGIQGRIEGSQTAAIDFLKKPVKAEELVVRARTLLQSGNLGVCTDEVTNTKSRILIIDDDIRLVRLVEYTLQKEGFDVLTAFDGLEGLRKVREEKPDLIILDIILPELNGLQLLHYIRQHSTAPVIVITGQSEANLLKKALLAGADGYVVKPFSPEDLLTLIRRKLKQPEFPKIPSG